MNARTGRTKNFLVGACFVISFVSLTLGPRGQALADQVPLPPQPESSTPTKPVGTSNELTERVVSVQAGVIKGHVQITPTSEKGTYRISVSATLGQEHIVEKTGFELRPGQGVGRSRETRPGLAGYRLRLTISGPGLQNNTRFDDVLDQTGLIQPARKRRMEHRSFTISDLDLKKGQKLTYTIEWALDNPEGQTVKSGAFKVRGTVPPRPKPARPRR